MKPEYIEVSAGVRYWEDTELNGLSDVGGQIPLRVGDRWCPVIRLSDGAVMDWPAGTTAEVHYKVCDNGEYWLLDANRNRIAKWSGDYVPNKFLCHGDDGFGDYIIFRICPDGFIAQWGKPVVHDDEWTSLVPAEAPATEPLLELQDALLDLLEDMARQHCCQNAKTYEVDSGAISTNADVLELLARHGRFVINRGGGRIVCGHWPEDADKYKPPVRDWDAEERRAKEIAASLRSALDHDASPTSFGPLSPEKKQEWSSDLVHPFEDNPPDLFVELSKLEVAFGDSKVRTVTDLVEDSAGASGT